MEQQPSKDDRRDIARRLFQALCARFPDRYIILIESRDLAKGGPFQPTLDSEDGVAPRAA
jgi:hypothetical protein